MMNIDSIVKRAQNDADLAVKRLEYLTELKNAADAVTGNTGLKFSHGDSGGRDYNWRGSARYMFTFNTDPSGRVDGIGMAFEDLSAEQARAMAAVFAAVAQDDGGK